MFIESIILHNYRAYKGHNQTSFKQDAKNIFLVAGNNGFGKTTFLTSLVWCLYGKLMVDVDEKFRREINDAQGYKNYARQSLHKELASVVNTYETSLLKMSSTVSFRVCAIKVSKVIVPAEADPGKPKPIAIKIARADPHPIFRALIK